MSVYNIGQGVRYWGTFTDTAGTPINPGTVNFFFRGAGTLTGAYYSGTAYGAGTYYHDVLHAAGGYALWRWEGSGSIDATTQGRDFVRYLGTNL